MERFWSPFHAAAPSQAISNSEIEISFALTLHSAYEYEHWADACGLEVSV